MVFYWDTLIIKELLRKQQRLLRIPYGKVKRKKYESRKEEAYGSIH